MVPWVSFPTPCVEGRHKDGLAWQLHLQNHSGWAKTELCHQDSVSQQPLTSSTYSVPTGAMSPELPEASPGPPLVASALKCDGRLSPGRLCIVCSSGGPARNRGRLQPQACPIPSPTCHGTLSQRGSWPLPLVETTMGSCSHRRAGCDITQAKSRDRQQLSQWPLPA